MHVFAGSLAPGREGPSGSDGRLCHAIKKAEKRNTRTFTGRSNAEIPRFPELSASDR